MPGGRPTDYDKKYCEIAIEYMKDGKHAIQLAAHLGISKATLYNWANEHEEFLDALNKARTASAAAWLAKYQDKAFGVTKDGSDYLLAKMIAKKDPELRDMDDPRSYEKENHSTSILNLVSSETLGAIAKDLSDAKK